MRSKLFLLCCFFAVFAWVLPASGGDAIHKTERDALGRLLMRRAGHSELRKTWGPGTYLYGTTNTAAGQQVLGDVAGLVTAGVPRRYWKVTDDRVVEMDQAGKDAAIADLIATTRLVKIFTHAKAVADVAYWTAARDDLAVQGKEQAAINRVQAILDDATTMLGEARDALPDAP